MSTMKTLEAKPGCIQRALEVLGDKWTPLIIRDLSTKPATFSALEASLTGISPRTLSQRIDMLESEKIIKKECYCERPPRFEYVLTEKGKDLQKVLSQMASWGAKYPS